VAVLAVAVIALVATSPPSAPAQSLEESATTSATLTADAPVASVRVTFTAGDEALWPDDPEVHVRRADLTVNVRADRPRDAVDGDSEPTPAAAAPVLRLTLVDVRTEPHRPVPPEHLEWTRVPLLDTCPQDEDCELTFDAVVEWIGAESGGELAVSVVARTGVTLEGPDTLPAGAETSLTLADVAVPAVPIVRDTVTAEAVLLGADRAHAMWDIQLEANAAAVAEPIAWPIEARALLAVDVVRPDEPWPPEERGPSPIAVTLVADDGSPDVPVEVRAGHGRHHFDPFAGCPNAARCVRSYTLVATWAGETLDDDASISWTLDAGVLHHDGRVPADGAEVTAAAPSLIVVRRGFDAVTASISGEIPLADPGNPVIVRTVRLDLPAAALREDLLGGPVPALTGTIELSSTSAKPLPADAIVQMSVSPNGTTGIQGDFPVAHPGEAVVAFPVRPAPTCRADAPCRAEIALRGSARAPGGSLDGHRVTVHWRLDVRLDYPEGAQPPDVTMGLSVGQP
jgi:hypothetical protein